jgi:hypothetical protein
VTRLFGKLMVVKFVEPENTLEGSTVTPSGTVIVLKFVQPEKMLPPAEVKLLG